MKRDATRRILYAFVLVIFTPLAFARGGYGMGQDYGYAPYQDHPCPYGYSCPRNNGGYGIMGPGMMHGYKGMPMYGYGPGNSAMRPGIMRPGMMGPGMMGPGNGYGRGDMGRGMMGGTAPESGTQ